MVFPKKRCEQKTMKNKRKKLACVFTASRFYEKEFEKDKIN